MNLPKRIDAQLIDKLTNYIQNSCKDFSKIMVGMYGELNSLVAAKVLQQALGEKVLVIVFDFDDAAKTNNLVAFCQQLSLNTYTLKRGAAYRNEIGSYGLHTLIKQGQFFKRFINYHLQIQADNMKTAIVDTIDKSDRLLGTRPEGFYGHFMPFYSLYKTEVYELANFLNIPEQFIQKPDDREKLDSVLYLLTEKELTPEEISEKFNIDLHWLKKLKSNLDKQPLKTTVSQFII